MAEGRHRPRFCAVLDGDIAHLIFRHIYHTLTRRICRGVCNEWRTMIPPVGFPVNYGTFQDYIRDHTDAQMGCLKLWMPCFHKLIAPGDQLLVIGYTIRHDRPTALRMVLAHSNVIPQTTPTALLREAIAFSARNVLAEVVIPTLALNGKRPLLFVRMFELASMDLFSWYMQEFPMPVLDASRIELYQEPIEAEAKIRMMHAKCQIADGWWKQWFLKAAGVRRRFRDDKMRQHYVEASPDDEHKYNETVAIAIVQHVLGGIIPEEGHEYLSNGKLKLHKQRNAALLSRLKRRKV